LTAWLVAQIIGPANTAPAKAKGHFSLNGAPLDTTPHMNAHIGGNQVTGLNNSNTARGIGNIILALGAEASIMAKGYDGHEKLSIKFDTSVRKNCTLSVRFIMSRLVELRV
jgi:hypothetical protein